jgi:formylglycine-generating enzyme required for sulfatase activity
MWEPEPTQQVKESPVVEPEMVSIVSGEFRMGDIQGAGDPDERPVHSVRIPGAFAMGRYEVTFDEYHVFALVTGREQPADHGWGRGRRPVINVSWEDAQAYAQWLSERTGKRYRLPTEAEWEYVARAGTETAYWWGNEVGENHANCAGCGSQWGGKQPAPVGSFQPNPWGLYDTAGNVWEWVEDCWSEKYEKALEDEKALAKRKRTPEEYLEYLVSQEIKKPWKFVPGGGDCNRRVIRGGSWGNRPWNVRSANRDGIVPNGRGGDLGFRLARDLDFEEIKKDVIDRI